VLAENHHYGHARVISEYAGLRQLRPLPGRLQHGWMPGPAVRPQERAEPWLKLLWSRRNLDQCKALGIERVVGFGSPFLYLPEHGADARPAGKSLLVFPFHGWEKQPLQGNMTSYAGELERLRSEGFGPVTVCLYWMEYEDRRCRALFEERGFRVVTMGHRNGDGAFLHRLRAAILEHAYVTSNRVCTAAFYALYCKRPFFLYGPPMGVSEHEDPTGEQFDAWQRKEFPLLAFDSFGDRAHAEIGDRELGLEFKHAPEEVKQLFAWRERDWWRRIGHRVTRRVYPLVGKLSRSA
jgi:hypothetical protein